MQRIYLVFLIALFLALPSKIEAQTLENLIEFFTVYPNKKAAEKNSAIHPAKAIFTPIISYAPETNLNFGVGMKGLFKMRGSGPETRTSNIPMSLAYSIDKKYQFFSGFDIFFPQERYKLMGSVNVQTFPSLYFGVGQNTSDSNEEEFGYRQILIEPIFLKNLFVPNLYFGGGLRYNRISHIKAEKDGLLDLSNLIGSKGSTSSGLQLAMIYDSRDNILNARKGFYLEFTHGFYSKALGGTQNYELTRFDFRYYRQVFKEPSSIVAFQLLTHSSHGDTPLFELARLGGNEIMRGYFEGRYTDRHLIATQVEWRQQLNRRWGAVAFIGVGGVAPTIDQFETFRPSAGLGVRFLIDPKEALNLRLDLGLGKEKLNYYFKIAEAF